MKQEAITTESLLEIMNHQLDVIDEKDKIIADLQQKLDYKYLTIINDIFNKKRSYKL